MKKRQIIETVLVVSALLLLSGCSAASPAAPTATATQAPTATFTPLPTQTPTPTPDPVVVALANARDLWQSNDGPAAILEYQKILNQSTDAAQRLAAAEGLIEIGSVSASRANEGMKNTGPDPRTCRSYELATSAFDTFLQAKDRPSVEKGSWSRDAAQADVGLLDCDWVSAARQTYALSLQRALDHMRLYPEQPEILEILAPAILNRYDTWVMDEAPKVEAEKFDDVLLQQMFDTRQLINERMGEYEVEGHTVTEHATFILAARLICSDPARLPPEFAVGTAPTHKYLSCPIQQQSSYSLLDLMNPGEIWISVETEFSERPPLECTGYNTDTKTSFSYSYPGRRSETYTVRSARDGKLIAKQTFQGDAPRCVFTTCQLNNMTNVATCRGGAGTYPSVVKAQEINAWLVSIAKYAR